MLPPPLLQKLETMDARFRTIEKDIAAQPPPPDLQTLSAEFGKLHPLVQKFRRWRDSIKKEKELEAMQKESAAADSEWTQCLKEERKLLSGIAAEEEKELRRLLSPKAEEDSRGCFLEIRAAVGGEESCLFAADLFRMYCRFAEGRGWQTEMVSSAGGESGGYREIIARIRGAGAYGRLRRESGAHRVQRVPDTESQGRVHTSVATVAVLAEARPEDNLNISPADLRVETFRSSGAGGQHVNTTDSAVRITHLPTGTVVECQDGRSQHKNREQAMAVLRGRILEKRRRERQEKEAGERRALVGGGDRAERIRTYNFPQGRITDHRIGLSLYKLPAMMEGDLDELLTALAASEEDGATTPSPAA